MGLSKNGDEIVAQKRTENRYTKNIFFQKIQIHLSEYDVTFFTHIDLTPLLNATSDLGRTLHSVVIKYATM
jgi:hypothetical protein